MVAVQRFWRGQVRRSPRERALLLPGRGAAALAAVVFDLLAVMGSERGEYWLEFKTLPLPRIWERGLWRGCSKHVLPVWR